VTTIFELLDVIRQKPGLFTGEPSISHLWGFLNGFDHALRAVENAFDRPIRPFTSFTTGSRPASGSRSQPTSGWRTMLLKSFGEFRVARRSSAL